MKISAYMMMAGVLVAPAAHVQCADYPDKPVRFVVPFTPGGSADIFARAIGQKLAEAWNQQVVIDNRGGSAGIIGSEIVAKSPPDGYTLQLVSSSFMISTLVYPKLPYDTLRDFTGQRFYEAPRDKHGKKSQVNKANDTHNRKQKNIASLFYEGSPADSREHSALVRPRRAVRERT